MWITIRMLIVKREKENSAQEMWGGLSDINPDRSTGEPFRQNGKKRSFL